MAKLLLSAPASDDQAGILFDLHSSAGLRTATKFRHLFQTLYLRLGEFPHSGAPRPTLGADVRIGVVAPYIVIYRYTVADDTVVVLRIVHGRRQISGSLMAGL